MSIRTLRSKSRIISFILLENEAIFIWERSDGILRKVSALKSNIDAHSMCIYITKIHRDAKTKRLGEETGNVFKVWVRGETNETIYFDLKKDIEEGFHDIRIRIPFIHLIE